MNDEYANLFGAWMVGFFKFVVELFEMFNELIVTILVVCRRNDDRVSPYRWSLVDLFAVEEVNIFFGGIVFRLSEVVKIGGKLKDFA